MVDHLLFDRSKWIKDLVGTSVTVSTNINLYKSYGDDDANNIIDDGVYRIYGKTIKNDNGQ